MSTHRRLRTLFRHVTSVTLAGGAVAACGASTGGGVDRSTFDRSICEGSIYAPLTGVTPARPVDYMEMREEYDVRTAQPADGGLASLYVQAKEGTPCATATNKPRCEADLQSYRVQDANGQLKPLGARMPGYTYLIYTRGDEVGVVRNAQQLGAFLDPVDTVKDAALVATWNGHGVRCGGKDARAVPGGFQLVTTTGSACGEGTHRDENVVTVTSNGTFSVNETVVVERGSPNCAVGRRPSGLVCGEARGDASDGATLGGYFAEMAHLEAASVVAFERLAAELRAHGAPMELARRAERSARDEVRHAKATARLAKRFGGEPERPVVGETGARALFDVALENAVEGCVRETFGALVATYQAESAADAQVASILRGIARDETRHAALAWDVAAWIEPSLTEAERARVREARRAAVDELARQLAVEPGDEVARTAGAPRARAARAMLERVRAELWAA